MKKQGIAKNKSPLLDRQLSISDKIFERLSHGEMYNLPTGIGKTYILMDVARRVAERGDRVIISVPTNYLVREMYSVAINHFGIGKSDVGIKIGANNYVSPERLANAINDESGDIFRMCDRGSLLSFYKEACNDEDGNDFGIFFDDFLKRVDLLDESLEPMVKNLVCYGQGARSSGDFGLITITNHYYLLSKCFYSKNFQVSDFSVLFDEVHQLGAVSETIFTDSFSPYLFMNTLSSVKREAEKNDFVGRIKLGKSIQTLVSRTHRLFKELVSPDKIGSYSTDKDRIDKMKSLALDLFNSEEYKYVYTKVEKQLPERAREVRYISSLHSVLLSESQAMSSKDRISFGVYYSPSKGYPTLRCQKKNHLEKLYFGLWEKLGFFAGVSGSVTGSFSPTALERWYGYSRIGLDGREKDRCVIHYYDRIFPKENISILFPEDDFWGNIGIDSVYDEDFDPTFHSDYYNKIIDAIHRHHDGKSTIVLCGGYKEAEHLFDLYRIKYNDAILDKAMPTQKSTRTIDKFKKNGGILFATRDYNTGVSLDGSLLERLFVLKLPYPDFTTMYWQELKRENPSKYRYYLDEEMLISFIQTLGRLQRSKDDKGRIVILDRRSIKDGIKTKLLNIAKAYGAIEFCIECKNNRPFNKKSEAEVGTDESSLSELFGF